MGFRGVRRAGHWPTLVCALLGLDLCFVVWGLLGPLSRVRPGPLRLSAGQEVLVATLPLLSGALLCPLFGLLTDRFGGRRMAILTLVLTSLPLLLGWLGGTTYPQLLLLASLLGVAGGSFAVALPLVSRWHSLEHQGLVLGLVGVGSGGLIAANSLVPVLMPLLGWHGIFGAALLAIVVLLLLTVLVVRDAPGPLVRRPWKENLDFTVSRDVVRFSVFYFLTFGGFVGLLLFLPFFFKEQYGIDLIRAGIFAGICGVFGSIFRPVGGFLSDRLGGVVMLFLCFLGLGFLGMWMSYLPHLEVATYCVFLTIALLGIGSGALLQLVPYHAQEQIGLGIGLVGGAGALGCCLVPWALVASYRWTGRFGPGFFHLGMIGFAAAGLLIQASRDWGNQYEKLAGHSRAGRPVSVRERGTRMDVTAKPMSS